MLVDDLGLDVTDEPDVTRSKSTQYATATGRADGDQEAVVRHLETALGRAGWVVEVVEAMDTTSRPSTQATLVRVRRDELVVQMGIYDRVGLNDAPPGTRWVKLSVAHEDAGLGWTEESKDPGDS
ncbi:MAG: hypothetical protein JJE52_02635 [Acidimicrobiia bacterium]|nr:hypothetical protein [Acidimicrobiia bacterium]